jgi:hypothetical protein
VIDQMRAEAVDAADEARRRMPPDFPADVHDSIAAASRPGCHA